PSPILSVCVCLPTHHLQPRVLPRPSIWAEPGPVIPRGQPVTIVCQGPGGLEAQEYHLHKEGKLETWDRQKPLEPGDKAKFFIRYMRVMHTGRYRCNYLKGEHQPSWTMVSQRASRGGTQALFPVGPVNTSLRWTFRCYGYYNTTSQIWSHPSDPLELLASGEEPTSHTPDYTVENLILMDMAAVILAVLGILLFQAWYSERRAQDAARRQTQERTMQRSE
uniref:Ig-like domain-containing protein n=1 Tax=Neovison vison TaxID=452646 RepID=A0A8C7BG03_NEOVI